MLTSMSRSLPAAAVQPETCLLCAAEREGLIPSCEKAGSTQADSDGRQQKLAAVGGNDWMAPEPASNGGWEDLRKKEEEQQPKMKEVGEGGFDTGCCRESSTEVMLVYTRVAKNFLALKGGCDLSELRSLALTFKEGEVVAGCKSPSKVI